MPDLQQLQQTFAIPGVVTVEAGRNGLPRVVVNSPHAEAHVYLHGAHVTHFARPGAVPLLFTSAASLFEPGRAIRGGVPVIFPWFGPSKADPRLPAHGFARTRPWTLRGTHVNDDGEVSITFSLSDDEATRAHWPHAFELVHTVSVGRSLGLSLEVRNTGPSAFTYEEALHTYLRVEDVRHVTVAGLGGREYIDKVDGGLRKTEQSPPFKITSETDRVYLGTPDTVTVSSPTDGRAVTVSKRGSLATVVWNPWADKPKTMPDFTRDEWPTMLCVETANVGPHAVDLGPGQRHVMTAQITTR